ncbi:YceH family protein [Photobacterium atrarenae]|uniref:YceH family protein n=1 Tax=Photobacterium atrarenae TaxID=865757 RepID=A0ABY5GM39_9GAMM|nr:YceH family protein [Photobacterium atrarenae]UTV30211.1 YceH family protein [Photobacterium atrarenae]
MDICFSPTEARVIGCLLEKEVTTPDQYPLTLNGLTTACNQKSNRDPVMALDEATVMDTVESLKVKRFIQEVTGFGSRVAKYQHRFCNTEFSTLQFSPQEKAAICVLLLRGPQTAGEIRTRTNRLCEFADVKEVEAVLAKLSDPERGGYIVKLPREAGKRDSRYMHLFSGDVDVESLAQVEQTVGGSGSPADDRVAQLELEVAAMKQDIAELKAQLDLLTSA